MQLHSLPLLLLVSYWDLHGPKELLGKSHLALAIGAVGRPSHDHVLRIGRRAGARSGGLG